MDVSSEDPKFWVADCFDTGDDGDEGYVLPVGEMDRFICRSATDEQILENWIKNVLISCNKSGGNSIKTPLDKIMEKSY